MKIRLPEIDPVDRLTDRLLVLDQAIERRAEQVRNMKDLHPWFAEDLASLRAQREQTNAELRRLVLE